MNAHDTQVIHRCVRDCAQARDGRGRWRQERACAAQLLADGASPAIAKATARAAAAVGRAISAAVRRTGCGAP